MPSLLETAGTFWREVAGRIGLRQDRGPIDSVSALFRFVSTRAALVAQKTLYGYVKTRMGTNYPKMFADDVFVHSVKIATLHVFAACLSDLTLYAVAHALRDQPADDGTRRTIALQCYQAAMMANAADGPAEFSPQEAIDAFERRLDETDWQFGALRRENFTRSPKALLRWAPIAPELKHYDTEIVENSIRFAWRDIRVAFDKRLDRAAVCADWSRQAVN